MGLSTKYLLTILKTPKFGQASAKFINTNAETTPNTLQDLLDLIILLKKKNPRIPSPLITDLQNGLDKANSIIAQSDSLGIQVINCNQKEYPSKLKRLDDYPIIIYYKGDLGAINNDKAVAIIGTRQPSDFGFRAGRKISGIFAENGFSIISGLAMGCDTAGHLGAVDKNSPTVAVLASGIDIIYPKENTALANKILECKGGLLSEYEPGFRPQPQTFVHRDRLQSALSDGLIVIETDIKGGTMHAVKTSKKIGIHLSCLAGHPESYNGFEKIRGNMLLISEGADALGSPTQIEEFMKKISKDEKEDLDKDEKKELISIFREDAPPIQEMDLYPGEHNKKSNIPESKVLDVEPRTQSDSVQSIPELQNRILELEKQLKSLTEEVFETNKIVNKLLNNLNSKEKSKKSSAQQPKLL